MPHIAAAPREEWDSDGWSDCDYFDLTVSWLQGEEPPTDWSCPRCGGTAFIGATRDYEADVGLQILDPVRAAAEAAELAAPPSRLDRDEWSKRIERDDKIAFALQALFVLVLCASIGGAIFLIVQYSAPVMDVLGVAGRALLWIVAFLAFALLWGVLVKGMWLYIKHGP